MAPQVRLGWHDAGTYDKELGLENWPRCGGANGSMRFKPEQSHSANAGLANAVLLLEDIKKQFPQVSHADLYQLASAVAVEVAGMCERSGRLISTAVQCWV